ncbi:hypothetical protein ABZ896_18610 [Streptomyces sp. NPDC047072]|uniref:hypothetical protein n=1 Tax=Streptomyces sp. NPDC047072 TaxID=3154809 RepID=UPI0033F22493
MRGWAGVWVIVGVVLVTACGGSTGGGGSTAGPSGDRSGTLSGGTPTHTVAAPSLSPASSPSTGTCVAGHAEVTVSPGDAPRQRVCVRPGTMVSLVLEPRLDDKRWVTVRSSAPVLVVSSDWQVEEDGTARASLRCAGTRGGAAQVTALAKAPDVAGAAKVAFSLDVSVVPYATQR